MSVLCRLACLSDHISSSSDERQRLVAFFSASTAARPITGASSSMLRLLELLELLQEHQQHEQPEQHHPITDFTYSLIYRRRGSRAILTQAIAGSVSQKHHLFVRFRLPNRSARPDDEM
ncbi:unnamed protein product [Nippostrongylus brasiliensis]|uniref:Uncharacterized protein n=1 Tax=Nippostrongylus brasiliensis TaxID=27835 RepID=A0A0N4XUJ8_NIPBR|nr:unnamed protein product [Nippostrongylus brasiliensis]